MQITAVNFGGFKGAHLWKLESAKMKNGTGKTSIINAYVFALSGKTLNGFVASNVDREDTDGVSVTLHHFIGLPPIRRTLDESGTTLYVGGGVATQSDFIYLLASRNVDLDFVIACANANVLTSNGLDTAELRKILSKADVLDNEEHDKIKKELSAVRKKRKTAEQHALTSVVVPVRQYEALTISDKEFATSFKNAKILVNDGIVSECPHCNHPYDKATLAKITDDFNEAKITVKNGLSEFTRILGKLTDYNVETDEIEDAKRLVAVAARARKDLVSYDAEIAVLIDDIATLDADSIATHLPEFVEVITEIPQKNGKMKSTCTLEYQGVPLRSINHAKRIEICVSILDFARAAKGMQDVPIIIDNAEAVQHGFENYSNVITFAAEKE